MSVEMERRYVKQEFRVSKDGEAPKISGYAAVFNSPSDDIGWTEEIDPQAFDAVMQRQPDVRALFNHDPNVVLGRTPNTLKLSIDGRGLAYEIDPPDTQAARDLMVSMRRGDISQSSFAFNVKRDQWTDNADGSITRRILEFGDLYDVSPVTYPAYPAASSQVSSLPATMPREMRSRFAMRSADPKQKTVDGEALTSDCFLIVGNPEDPETWHLPWKFSTEEKIKSHLRDALARFDQVDGVSAEDKQKAWNELVKLCKEHDIEVSEGDRSLPSIRELRSRLAAHMARL
jgi:HK97 family phage prohead protease